MAFAPVRTRDPIPSIASRGSRIHRTDGFTLIELMVVTGIIMVISGLIFANDNKFGGKVQLQNLAYDIALTIRQAQVYGISVQRFTTDTFANAYGVHFDRNTNPASRDDFELFADAITQDGMYTCSDPAHATPTTCELVSLEELVPGYHVADICVPATQTQPCGHSSLDVTFQRPDPDAYIRADGQGGLNESALIKVTSPQGDSYSVVVEQNGQISVQ